MQTFLPYPNFRESARVLDRQRLGKQRVEAFQILRTLAGITQGWRNHPAVRMWRGYSPALAQYGFVMCDEWRARGYQDTLSGHFTNCFEGIWQPPPWLGDPAFHLSHRANLVRKNPAHYQPLFGDLDITLPYVWPTSALTTK